MENMLLEHENVIDKANLLTGKLSHSIRMIVASDNLSTCQTLQHYSMGLHLRNNATIL